MDDPKGRLCYVPPSIAREGTPMATTYAPARYRLSAERLFFTGMAAAMLVTVFVGFGPTYYLLPWMQGVTVRGQAGGAGLTPLVHLHAVVFSAWILLFMTQTGLIAARRPQVHRWLGAASAGLAAAVIVIGLWTAIASGREHSTPPGWANDEAFLIVPFMSIALFTGFFAAGFAWRRRPDYHKRLMLLATVAMMVPALARITRMIQPSVIPGGVWGALILVNLFFLALVAFDLVRLRRVHPATMIGVAINLVSWPARLRLGYTDAWQGFADSLIG